ncbi:MAG: glycosyltransferase family 2 protein, partial [Calditrichaeota bacterium]
GFTRALNQGLARSRGEYILVLNPDTVLQPGCLTVLLGVLAERERVGVVAPQLLNPDGTVQPSCRRFPRYRDVLFEASGLSRAFSGSRVFNGWKMGDFDHTTGRGVDQPQGACLLFHRSVLTKVGLWDEGFPMFFSDVDWCRRVKHQGYEIWFEPTARVVHLQGRSIFQHRPRMIWSSHCSFYRYFKKYDGISPANVLVGAVLFFSAIVRVAWHALFGRRGNRTRGRQPVLAAESTGTPTR